MGEENFPNADEQKELSNHIRQIAQTIYEDKVRRLSMVKSELEMLQSFIDEFSSALSTSPHDEESLYDLLNRANALSKSSKGVVGKCLGVEHRKTVSL